MRLAAGLRSHPLGELEYSPDPRNHNRGRGPTSKRKEGKEEGKGRGKWRKKGEVGMGRGCLLFI